MVTVLDLGPRLSSYEKPRVPGWWLNSTEVKSAELSYCIITNHSVIREEQNFKLGTYIIIFKEKFLISSRTLPRNLNERKMFQLKIYFHMPSASSFKAALQLLNTAFFHNYRRNLWQREFAITAPDITAWHFWKRMKLYWISNFWKATLLYV